MIGNFIAIFIKEEINLCKETRHTYLLSVLANCVITITCTAWYRHMLVILKEAYIYQQFGKNIREFCKYLLEND